MHLNWHLCLNSSLELLLRAKLCVPKKFGCDESTNARQQLFWHSSTFPRTTLTTDCQLVVSCLALSANLCVCLYRSQLLSG